MESKNRKDGQPQDRKELAEKIVKNSQKESGMNRAEQLIKDNKIQFEYDGKKYRCRLLTNFEKDEINILRMKKMNSMLQEKDEHGNYVYLTEKALIKLLKERGDGDIAEIEEETKKVDAEINALALKLGENIANKSSDNILEEQHNQIRDLETRKQIIETQRTMMLSTSIENQIFGFMAKVIACYSTEIEVEGTWEKAFKNVEEFDKAEDDLVTKIAINSSILQYS